MQDCWEALFHLFASRHKSNTTFMGPIRKYALHNAGRVAEICPDMA